MSLDVLQLSGSFKSMVKMPPWYGVPSGPSIIARSKSCTG